MYFPYVSQGSGSPPFSYESALSVRSFLIIGSCTRAREVRWASDEDENQG